MKSKNNPVHNKTYTNKFVGARLLAGLLIGWAAEDITPDKPVFVSGQLQARISRGVMDPITVTALALDALGDNTRLVLVSCDLSSISDGIRNGVRTILQTDLPELPSESVLISATHAHSAPLTRTFARYRENAPLILHHYGIELPAMDPAEYVAWANRRIADAVIKAWKQRRPGGVAYGLGHAVIGCNRLMTYNTGKSKMFGPTDISEFSHVEGYEDHSLNVLATYDTDNMLTGLILNLACPSQVNEGSWELTADFWHDTRVELRRRLGDRLFVLPQCSAAGDQSPHVMLKRRAEARMLYLKGLSDRIAEKMDCHLGNKAALRKELALRIADGTTSILPAIAKAIDFQPILRHKIEILKLPRRIIPEADRDNAAMEAEKRRQTYNQMLRELESNPAQRDQPEWYNAITRAYVKMRREEMVLERFELQKTHPYLPVEMHVARLGEIAFASNPFELYLDYGIQIQERAKAVQTFIVQLAGPGSYLPTERSVAGGAYGAVPASTEIGPEGGRILVEWTLNAINNFWE